MAASLEEFEGGHLTSVDLLNSEERTPNLESLLKKAGLEKYVTIQREVNTYNWFLNRKIDEQTKGYQCEPIYDFCFIDGPKNWSVDGLAFFLVDKLLKPNGWIMFDDYAWSYGDHAKKHGEGVMTSGVDTRTLAILRNHFLILKEVFNKLVMQHENYSNFKVEDQYIGICPEG